MDDSIAHAAPQMPWGIGVIFSGSIWNGSRSFTDDDEVHLDSPNRILIVAKRLEVDAGRKRFDFVDAVEDVLDALSPVSR